MALTREELNEYWPNLWVGDKQAKDIDTSDIPDEEIDENAPASPYVIRMLGFDPDELFSE
jgi:hypothetical protein